MIKFKVTVDLQGLEQAQLQRFTLGSPAQKMLDSAVFYRGIKYMPQDTGNFISRSVTVNNRQFGKGELIFPSPTANYLWLGLSAKGKPLNYTKTKNPLAGAKWTERMWANDEPIITAELQRAIDEGKV